MIQIQTVTSSIIKADGTLPNGRIDIFPNDAFEFTDTDTKKKKVATDVVQVTFTAGVLAAAFNIAPTVNASQDKTNLYYTARFFTDVGDWTEYWTIDASGPSVLEITDITKVIPSPVASTTDFLASDNVSTTPIAGGIPRAGSAGTIDPGWVVGGLSAAIVYFFTDTTLPGDPIGTPPAGVVLAVGYSAKNDQTYDWANGRWRVVGG